MKEFSFSTTSYKEVLEKLSMDTGMPIRDNQMDLPASLGKGYLRFLRLPNRMEALLMDMELADDFWFNRGRTDREHYIFVCEEILNADKVVIDIDGDRVVRTEERVAGMHLFSFLSDLHQFSSRGSRVRGFRVVLSTEWLASYLRVEKMDDVLQRYLQLRAGRMHMKGMDPDTLRLLNDILDHPPDMTVDEMAFIQNRVMMVLEGFFAWMFEAMQAKPRLTRIAREDIDRIRKVEEYLLRDLSASPGIGELARYAAMSATRLKSLFRQVYGLPPYEYFQQHRMLRAKEMFQQPGKSIREIGQSLGYSNMSNFTLAFRKVFGVNPSDIRR
jgi:AraC-like DNA-binding protein